MYYIKNLETDKINIISTKAEYKNLPDEQRNFIKSYCRFNGYVWASKAEIPNAWYVVSKLKEWNIEYKGEEGTKLPFAERVERKQERAELRAERMETRFEKCVQLSKQHFHVAMHLGSFIPMGQPILIGHHSEGWHRRYLKKIDANMRKSCEAHNKSAYYAKRLAAAITTAEGVKYKDIGYLGNRIKESKAKISKYERQSLGKIYAHLEPETISEQAANYWKKKQAEEQEKLDYYYYCLKQCTNQGDKTLFNKEILQGKKKVLIEGSWNIIIKLNKTTVYVPNIFYSKPEHQIEYPLKYPYHKIQDAR